MCNYVYDWSCLMMNNISPTDWVDVANDLLSKCHINLRLKKLTDCDAAVFVALYEAILGEKVPDYVGAPSSLEDDVHNVQSVIDSLALDYLQISLSHITGENIVRGDKESIRNLLEIFDGLLEYLTEQISEEELPGEGATISTELAEEQLVEQEKQAMLECLSQASSVQSALHSSKCSLPSWSADGSESTGNLIRLGDSARSFVPRQEELTSEFHQSEPLLSRLVESPLTTEQDVVDSPAGPALSLAATSVVASLLRGPLRSAIPLQPPYQTTPLRPEQHCNSGTQSPSCIPIQRGHGDREVPVPVNANSQPPGPSCNSTPANGLHSPHLSPDESERSMSSVARAEVDKEQVESSSTGPRRVLFRTQPDVLFLTLDDKVGHSNVEEEKESNLSYRPSSSSRQRCRGGHGGRTCLREGHTTMEQEADLVEDPLSQRRQRNRQAEQELHQMSEKLSQRLEELDLMLKRALGEMDVSDGTREEDKQSQHSDSIMECHEIQMNADALDGTKSSRTCSLSPSPPPLHRSLEAQLGGAVSRDSQEHVFKMREKELQSQQMESKALSRVYEKELKQFEERERADIEEARERAQEAEREYREAIWKDIPRPSKPSRVYSPKVVPQLRPPRARYSTLGRGRAHPRKPTPMKIHENDLLPTLLEEFPHLQLSPHTVNRMWKQQLKQVDRLAPLPDQRSRVKLANQVLEAQRRRDLLTEIIRKEQEHNHRLRDFRERIQQQKSTQNKLREQRQQVARARKYYNDYHVQLRARLMRARTREERMLKQIFEEGLELQKAQLREQRAYAKEQRLEHQRRHRDELESMENYYKDQFSMLAECLARERQEIQVRKKAQEKALVKLKRELRARMEREIRELQKIIIQNDEDDYFRDMEVERLRGRLHMASFQYAASHLS
ncbi:centrosomal protein of 95 kDa-like isoform X1 [Scleropages formosus]|uniref:centrosomal protein of 95 kDa-like isoform X1 n=1 Tax=Scleropages formosus TaxID=113540 RepID=UPI0010FAACD0|nr:centrosomal protein of 95 kDa isoform X1 [Scleropages formosus]